ncbi:hypothetical protein J6590_099858, partial [Homalodisca vitripennis]
NLAIASLLEHSPPTSSRFCHLGLPQNSQHAKPLRYWPVVAYNLLKFPVYVVSGFSQFSIYGTSRALQLSASRRSYGSSQNLAAVDLSELSAHGSCCSPEALKL